MKRMRTLFAAVLLLSALAGCRSSAALDPLEPSLEEPLAAKNNQPPEEPGNIPTGEPMTEEELETLQEVSRQELEQAREQRLQAPEQAVLEPVFRFGAEDEWEKPVTDPATLQALAAYLRDLRESPPLLYITADYAVKISLTLDGAYREYAVFPFGTEFMPAGRVLIQQIYPEVERVEQPAAAPPVEQDDDAIPAEMDETPPADAPPWLSVDVGIWELIGTQVELGFSVKDGAIVWDAAG